LIRILVGVCPARDGDEALAGATSLKKKDPEQMPRILPSASEAVRAAEHAAPLLVAGFGLARRRRARPVGGITPGRTPRALCPGALTWGTASGPGEEFYASLALARWTAMRRGQCLVLVWT